MENNSLSNTGRNIPTQTRSRDRVAKILDAAASVLAEKGYAGMTMRAVANEAELKQSSIYRYWPNKQAITGDLIDRFIEGQDMLIAECRKMGKAGHGWREIMAFYIRRLRKTVETDHWIASCQIALISDPAMHAKDQFVQNHFTRQFAELMRENEVGETSKDSRSIGQMMYVLLDAYVLSLNRHEELGNDVIETEFNRTLASYLEPFAAR